MGSKKMKHFNLIYTQWKNPLEIVDQENKCSEFFIENIILITVYSIEEPVGFS